MTEAPATDKARQCAGFLMPGNRATQPQGNPAPGQPSPRATGQPSPRATQQPSPRATQQPSPRATQQPSPRATQPQGNPAPGQPSPRATQQPSPRATQPQGNPATQPQGNPATQQPGNPRPAPAPESPGNRATPAKRPPAPRGATIAATLARPLAALQSRRQGPPDGRHGPALAPTPDPHATAKTPAAGLPEQRLHPCGLGRNMPGDRAAVKARDPQETLRSLTGTFGLRAGPHGRKTQRPRDPQNSLQNFSGTPVTCFNKSTGTLKHASDVLQIFSTAELLFNK